MTHYPNIFQPLELRHRQLDNRIVFGAHTANMSEMGLPGERHRGYYEERARRWRRHDRGRTDAGARHRGADAR